MFTGIITDIGTITSVENNGGDTKLGVQTKFNLSQTDTGASIACSGCCLTVIDKINNIFFVEVSNETLSKTTIGSWKEGTKINLEQALKMGDELGGHIVSGHVDGLATLKSITEEGDSYRLVFKLPEEFGAFIAPKGSITLDGVSLTVNEVEGTSFGVNIISHTWKNTTLGQQGRGDKVHFEIDMLARYVQRALEYKKPPCP